MMLQKPLQYFQSVFTEVVGSGFTTIFYSYPAFSYSFKPDNALQELIDVIVSKACGPDLIPPLLLKKAAPYICVSLSKLFTQSMSSGGATTGLGHCKCCPCI